jgi:hypothetical protein
MTSPTGGRRMRAVALDPLEELGSLVTGSVAG